MTATPELATRGNYLFFEVGESRFCAPVDEVQAIVELNGIHALPFAPKGVTGTFLFRERIAVVCDLSRVLDVDAGLAAHKNLSVVVGLPIGLVAFRVDHVSDIVAGSEVRLQMADRRALKEWMDGYVMQGPHIAFLTTFEKLLNLFGIAQLTGLVHGTPVAQASQGLPAGTAQPAVDIEPDATTEARHEPAPAGDAAVEGQSARADAPAVSGEPESPLPGQAPQQTELASGAMALEARDSIGAEAIEIVAEAAGEPFEPAPALSDEVGQPHDPTAGMPADPALAGEAEFEGYSGPTDALADAADSSREPESDLPGQVPHAEGETVWQDEPAATSASSDGQVQVTLEAKAIVPDSPGRSQDAEALPKDSYSEWLPDQATEGEWRPDATRQVDVTARPLSSGEPAGQRRIESGHRRAPLSGSWAKIPARRPRARILLVLLALLLIIVGGWWLARPDATPQPAEARKPAPVQAVAQAPFAPTVAREPTPDKVEIIGKDFEMRVERANQEKGAQPLSVVPNSPDEVVHVVRRGDTLWDIAARNLGNPYRYPELARNSAIRNPNLIHPGDVVRIRKRR